jgi:phosphopantothenoylcysteine synthetase/decarboxylase
MSLKVTIKDAAGNPTTLDVHEIHITSNDAANSINVAPATAAATAPAVEPNADGSLLGPATQEQSQAMQEQSQAMQQQQAMQEEQKINSFNANAAMINKSLQEKSLQRGLSAADRENIANTHQELHNQNYQTHFGSNPGAKVKMLQPGVKRGGTRNQRNKRAKRTRKRRQSRKKSSKR